MLETKIYNQKGKETGVLELPQNVFGAPLRADLVHQVVEGMRSNARSGTAHTKDRGEVSGGGKKPWKQKGTGRARHGSIRSPIWVGGGVAHGPRKEKDYTKKITKKMRAQALCSVLSKKFKDGEIIFIDSLSLEKIKTKDGLEIMKNISKILKINNIENYKKPRILTALFSKNEKTQKSFNNLPFLNLDFVKNLNPLSVLNHKYLIIENGEESIKFLASRIK